MLEGKILKGIGGFYYVKSGDEIYECKARGIFRKEEIKPLPGDNVCIEVLDDRTKTGNIIKIKERSTELQRPAVANVDQLAAVIAVKSPEPDLLLLDKLLLIAQIKGISAFICINKIDLGNEDEYEAIKNIYTGSGYRVIPLSAVTQQGFDELREELKSSVTVFAGQSGVGKSTILNTIMQSRVMETGEVSSRIHRGRHTTRHAELVELTTGGFIVDTPGFSSLELENLGDILCEISLDMYYPEFREYIGGCRFKGCSHRTEPGCLVIEAVEAGRIDRGRYGRYLHFYSVIEDYRENIYKNRAKSGRKSLKER